MTIDSPAHLINVQRLQIGLALHQGLPQHAVAVVARGKHPLLIITWRTGEKANVRNRSHHVSGSVANTIAENAATVNVERPFDKASKPPFKGLQYCFTMRQQVQHPIFQGDIKFILNNPTLPHFMMLQKVAAISN